MIYDPLKRNIYYKQNNDNTLAFKNVNIITPYLAIGILRSTTKVFLSTNIIESESFHSLHGKKSFSQATDFSTHNDYDETVDTKTKNDIQTNSSSDNLEVDKKALFNDTEASKVIFIEPKDRVTLPSTSKSPKGTYPKYYRIQSDSISTILGSNSQQMDAINGYMLNRNNRNSSQELYSDEIESLQRRPLTRHETSDDGSYVDVTDEFRQNNSIQSFDAIQNGIGNMDDYLYLYPINNTSIASLNQEEVVMINSITNNWRNDSE